MIVRLLLPLLAIQCVLSIQLYYRIGGGDSYGPFPEGQLHEWVHAGFFSQATNLQISTSPVPETFVLYRAYDPGTSIHHERQLSPRKRSGILKIMSRKAGSLVKFNGRTLLGMTRLVTSPMKTDDTIASTSLNRGDNICPVAIESQGSASAVPPTGQAEHSRAQDSDWYTDASQQGEEWPTPDSTIRDNVSTVENAAETSTEDSLLSMLKRDPVDATVKTHEDLLKTTGTKQVPKEKTKTVSVRSLPKADYSLWDSEKDSETVHRSVLGEDFLADLKLTSESATASGGNDDVGKQVRPSKRVVKQLSLVCAEIGRYVLSWLAWTIPGPMRTSCQYLTALVMHKEDRVILLQLGAWLVLSILRWLLYIAAVPSVYDALAALSHNHSPSAAAPTGILRMHNTNAASAGDIVTTILRQAPSVQRPAHLYMWQKRSFVELLLAMVEYFQRLPHQLSTEECSTFLSRVLDAIKPSSIYACALHAQQMWLSLDAQLRTVNPAVVTLTLVAASIVVLDGILLPAVQFQLKNRLITDPACPSLVLDSDNINMPNEEEDELLDPARRTKATPSTVAKPAWLPLSLEILKRKVSSGPFVSYLQDAGGYTTRTIMWIWLVSHILPDLGIALSNVAVGDRAKSASIVLSSSFVLLTVAGIVDFYGVGMGDSCTRTAATKMEEERPSMEVERSTQRTSYLTSVISDNALVDWCKRWHLLDYVTTCLSQEMAQLGRKLQLEHATSAGTASTKPAGKNSEWLSNFCTVATLACSIYAWSYCCMSFLQAADDRNVDIARSLTGAIAKAIADNLLPHQLLQRITYFLMRVEPPAVTTHDIIAARPLISDSLSNALIMCAGVLLLPNALRLRQFSSLQRIRAIAPALTSARMFRSTQEGSLHNAAQALILAQQAVIRLPDLEDAVRQMSTGWTTDGPNRTAGIELSHLTATSEGRVVLKDVTLTFPAGQITVVLSPDIGTPVAPTSLLGALCSGSSNSREVRVVAGSVRVQGREANEWNAAALHRRMTFLSADEPKLCMQAGALAGCLPGTAGTRLRQALRAQVASGAHAVLATLPAGPATLVIAGSDARPAVNLTADQWSALHVSRALCSIDAPVVLLDQPTTHMSEAQESLFFTYLREHLRPDHVVIVTSVRTRTVAHADRAIQLSDEGRVVEVAENVQQRLSEAAETDALPSTIMSKLKRSTDRM